MNITNDNLVKFLNQLSIVISDNTSLVSLESFLCELNASLNFYSMAYEDTLNDRTLPNISEIKIPFIMPDLIVPKIKKMLNNDSYFAIIIDKYEKIPLNTAKAINNYVTSRINSDLSIKVACEPDKWLSYYDLSGVLAERTHDYGEIEFDSSNSEYVKKLMQKGHNF